MKKVAVYSIIIVFIIFISTKIPRIVDFVSNSFWTIVAEQLEKEEAKRGQITYGSANGDKRGAYILDLSSEKKTFVPDCLGIQLLNDEEALLICYRKIKIIDIVSKDEKCEYDTGCNIDYVGQKTGTVISFSSGKSIYELDLTSGGMKCIVTDNGSKYHGWNNDSLIYSNDRNEIIELNPEENTSHKICTGTNPTVSPNGSLVAYSDESGKLNVLSLTNGEKYMFKFPVYYYCFSPDSKFVLIESEMSTATAIKNLFVNGRVIGHKIIVWNYGSNKEYAIVESCESGAGEGFSWR